MSTVSALKVFALFGKKSGALQPSATRRNSDCETTMATIPATKPDWLQLILDGHQQALDECKQTNESFMKKFDEVASGFKKDHEALQEKQTATSSKLQDVEADVSSLKADVQIHSTDITNLDQRVDDTKSELLAKIDDLRAEFNEKLTGKATNPDRPIVPSSLSVVEQCRIEREFDELLTKSRNMENCFAMGRVTNGALVGYMSPPKTIQEIFSNYFTGLNVEVIPGLGKSQIKRLRVDKKCLADFRANLELYEFQIQADGWWISPDVPQELRFLRSNAYKFFKEARSNFDTVRATFIDISLETGCITVDGVEIFPVYLIPKDTKKWATLMPIFDRIVSSILEVDWVVKKTSSVQIDQSLIQEWADVVGLKPTPNLNVTEGSDAEMHDASSAQHGGG